MFCQRNLCMNLFVPHFVHLNLVLCHLLNFQGTNLVLCLLSMWVPLLASSVPLKPLFLGVKGFLPASLCPALALPPAQLSQGPLE